MTWALLPVLASLVVVLALSRYRHGLRVSEWVFSLSPDHATVVGELGDQVAREHAMLERAYRTALERTDPGQALQLLEAAAGIVEGLTPGRLERLRWVIRLSRMAAAVQTGPAMSPAALQLGQLRALAGLGAVAHAILVSPAERLAFRGRVLILGFRLAVGVLRRAGARGAWRRFGIGLEDWRTLDVEHVGAVRELLLALAAERATAPRALSPDRTIQS